MSQIYHASSHLRGHCGRVEKGFLRGLRSENVLEVMSVSFNPKISFSLVIMPRRFCRGFSGLLLCLRCRLGFVCPIAFKHHRIQSFICIVFYSVYSYSKAFARFSTALKSVSEAVLAMSSKFASETKSSNAQTRVYAERT